MLRLKHLYFSMLIIVSSQAHSQVISRFAGNYISGYSGDWGLATSACISQPSGVYADRKGNVYIAEFGNHVIRKVDIYGTISTVAGTGTQGYSGDGGPATAAKLNHPTRIAMDGAGNLYIADAFNEVIRKVSTSGVITTVAGNHTRGYSGDGGPATAAQFDDPNGVWADAAGNIYIADSHNNVIRKVNTSGIISTIIGNGYNAGTTNGGYSGDGGPATAAELWYPESVIIDDAGNFYIAELFNNIVRKVNAAGIISTIAGTGASGYTGDGGPATSATFRGPYDVAINSAGVIFITDNQNDAVRSIDASGIIHTYAGTGTSGNSGDGGSPDAAELHVPIGISIDQYDELFIADAYNDAIRLAGPWLTSVSHSSAITSENLSVFPNPSTGRFTIQPLSNNAEQIRFTITNVLGQTIQEISSATDRSTEVVLNNAAPGIYFVTAATAHGTKSATLTLR